MTTQQSGVYRIQPAARIITAIGANLIKDVPAAIVELVKNSYDADASFVEIVFSAPQNPELKGRHLRIQILDDGHGMSFDRVKNVWMVPATSDKLVRKSSPNKRILQGQKGIGRYAAAILGSELLLQTVSTDGEKTTVFIDWDLFEKHDYLSEIEFLIETTRGIYEPSGTKLDIRGTTDQLNEWTNSQIELLLKELRKMLSPLKDKEDKFDVVVRFEDFQGDYANQTIRISPFPLIDLYDYRLVGIVDASGSARLMFQNNSLFTEPFAEEVAPFRVQLEPGSYLCGPLKMDIRVFDRDPESIQNLINKGAASGGLALGKNEARRLLTETSGVSIYRGPFRVRPYGDAGDDWLELNRLRVQNPSLRIGSDQVIGSVEIAPEEVSHLDEKSARDGLKENGHFRGLRDIVRQCITQLEIRRFDLRRKTGKGRRTNRLDLHQFDMTDLTFKIEAKLRQFNIDLKRIDEVKKIIKNAEDDQNTALQDIQRLISIYQGQATLGKVIMVVQHEGRRSLGWFRNLPPIIEDWITELSHVDKDEQNEILHDIAVRLRYTADEALKLTDLFHKLDPLSVKNRDKKKPFSVMKAINGAVVIFQDELKSHNIRVSIDCSESAKLIGWEEDFIIAFTNLIENSIYWMNSDVDDKAIKIRCFQDGSSVVIDFQDTGPGIPQGLIENGLIFEPGFSTKSSGTGLGLAIAGEAIARNEGELKALESRDGAYFRIELGGAI